MAEEYTLEKIKEELVSILDGDWKFTQSTAPAAQVWAARAQVLHALADILLREEKSED